MAVRLDNESDSNVFAYISEPLKLALKLSQVLTKHIKNMQRCDLMLHDLSRLYGHVAGSDFAEEFGEEGSTEVPHVRNLGVFP
jgi:hypothetical protein